MGKTFPKTHQFLKLFNHINVKVKYTSLTNFKRVVNGDNKNILNKPARSPAYSCNLSTPDLKENHPHYIGLKEHTFKGSSTNISILLSTTQRETQQNFLI